jgi:hypothetical protein
MIAIYNNDHAQTLAHVCDTLEDASRWIGCSTQAFYKSLHLYGVMKVKNYIIERV